MPFLLLRRNTQSRSNSHRQGWAQALNLHHLYCEIVRTVPGTQLGTARRKYRPATTRNNRVECGQPVFRIIRPASLILGFRAGKWALAVFSFLIYVLPRRLCVYRKEENLQISSLRCVKNIRPGCLKPDKFGAK